MAIGQFGLYSLPRDLVLKMQFALNPVVTRVAYPVIASIQEDVGRVRAIYLQTVNMTASVTAPMYVGLAVFADQVAELFFGPGWQGAGKVMSVLALWGALRSVGNPVGSLLYALGKTKLSFQWNLAVFALTVPTVFLGAKFGPLGLAGSMCALASMLFIPGWWILVRPQCGLGLGEYAGTAFKPLLFAAIAALPASYLSSLFVHPVAVLLVGLAVGAGVYTVLSVRFNYPWIAASFELLGLGRQKAS
jgi:O-antigen/teichoic acid export membrane protein